MFQMSITLHFEAANPLASRTLLLLHGAFSSHHEWDLVNKMPSLSQYHLLIPDLPGHGRSTSQAISFDIVETAALLADLITKHAKNGKADIVGLSLGGYVAIFLAQKYPNIIGQDGLFVTGCGRPWPAPGSWMTWASGLVLFLSVWSLTHMSKTSFEWIYEKFGLRVEDELFEDMKATANYRLGQAVAENLSENAQTDRNWKVISERTSARACVVTGALDDGEKDASIRGEQLRKGNPNSKAVKVEGKRHAWNLQDPELFASGVKAWIEHESLPEEFIVI